MGPRNPQGVLRGGRPRAGSRGRQWARELRKALARRLPGQRINRRSFWGSGSRGRRHGGGRCGDHLGLREQIVVVEVVHPQEAQHGDVVGAVEGEVEGPGQCRS